MNKSLSFVNLSLELHFVSTFWLGSNISGSYCFFTFCPALNFRDQPWRLTLLWYRTDICSCKLSAKVSLMLDNPFLVPSLCKLNHISLCFIQISTKSAYSLQGKQCFFWSHPRCFGPLGKFQHNIKIYIKTARVSRLSVSCDYDGIACHDNELSVEEATSTRKKTSNNILNKSPRPSVEVNNCPEN